MVLHQIIIFFVLISLVVCNLNDFFCFPLCALSQCQGIQQNQCRNCTAGFKKAINNTTSNCIVINPMVNGQRYQPISVTEDISYPLLGTETLSTLNVAVNNIQLTPDQQCSIVNNTDYEYLYFGDFVNTTIVNIKSPTSISIPNIFRVRLRFWLITIDEWDQLAKLSIKFLSNTSQAVKTYSLKDSSMNQSTQICGDPLFPQRYQIYDAQFLYNISTAPEFQLSTTGNTFSNPWGIKQVVLMVRVCHFYCIGCTGDSNSNCLACDYPNYPTLMKSGSTCALSCAGGYGLNITDSRVCLKCMTNCNRCFAVSTNCTQCNGNYFIYIDTTISCVQNCPTHFFKNLTGYDFCDTCASTCQNCSLIKTNCTSCYTGTYLYNYKCHNPCPVKTFSNDLTLKCHNCSTDCYQCEGISTNCTSCVVGGPQELYLKNNTCFTDCGNGFFKFNNLTLGPYLCLQCDSNCTTCEYNQTYCYNCSPNYFFYQNYCSTTCPTEYFTDINTWTCLSCAIYCVGLQTNLFFKDNLKQQLIFELIFTQDLTWNLTDIKNFVIIEQNSRQLSIQDHFTVTYQILNPKQFHIIIQPKGYIYLKNIIFTFKTISFSNISLHYAANLYPFKQSNYDRFLSKSWTMIKSPGYSQIQKQIINTVSKISDMISDVSTNKYVQQIKKTGLLAILFPGAQITSVAILVNKVPPQNCYEGTRIWASTIFFDVPQWEEDSEKNKYLVDFNAADIVKESRLLSTNSRTLFDTSSLEWRFQRTGHTSFFIFDCYMNIFLIILCWTLVLIGNCCISHKIRNKNIISKFYSLTHKIHQVSIFYITLTTMLQWIYFDAASVQRWISFGICILFNIYFFSYELYIYYDMITYPVAHIGNQKYEYYCLKYGSLLKNIRYQQYDPSQQWKIKHWFRPYNYHILSYYKKFLMMICLPIFNQSGYAQIGALLVIQFLQILRFLFVWPFKSKIRNIIRLLLDLCLEAFFISIMIQSLMVSEVIKNNPQTLEYSINLFNNFGWVGFFLVFIFNFGHFFIYFFDFVFGCRSTNRQLMNQARKNYYMQKIKSYQNQNQDVPLQTVNRWVKLGNLNQVNEDILSQINLKIQNFKIYKNKKGFFIELKRVISMAMRKQINFQIQKNVETTEQFKKQFLLQKNRYLKQLYDKVEQLYNEHAAFIDIYTITIRTYQKIDQSILNAGDKVQIQPSKMNQTIQLQTFGGQKKLINNNQLLIGFPLNENDLKQIMQNAIS